MENATDSHTYFLEIRPQGSDHNPLLVLTTYIKMQNYLLTSPLWKQLPITYPFLASFGISASIILLLLKNRSSWMDGWMDGWMAQWFRYLEPICVALGKLYSPRTRPEEGTSKPLLNSLYLGKPEKGHHKSKLS